MIRRVRILRRAENDLVEIGRYLGRDAPAAADQLLDHLLGQIQGLSDHPHRGALPRDERLLALGYRFLVVGQHLIFYKVLRSEVRIYRVVHGKRAYEGWL